MSASCRWKSSKVTLSVNVTATKCETVSNRFPYVSRGTSRPFTFCVSKPLSCSGLDEIIQYVPESSDQTWSRRGTSGTGPPAASGGDAHLLPSNRHMTRGQSRFHNLTRESETKQSDGVCISSCRPLSAWRRCGTRNSQNTFRK